MELEEARKRVEALACASRQASIQAKKVKEDHRKRKQEHKTAKGAKKIITELAEGLKEGLTRRLRSITTKAARAVLGKDAATKVEFGERGGRPTIEILVSSDGKTFRKPGYGKGGGVGDVVAFGLRMAVWGMCSPRSRPLFVMDEPMRFVSKGRQGAVSAVLKAMADKAGVQFVIVTHKEELKEYADKTFHVDMESGISHVSEVRG